MLKTQMLKTLIVLTLAGGAWIANAQARPTASRLADGQVGVSFVNGNSDYARSRFDGFGIYADLDFHHGIGAEFEFHQIGDGDSYTHIYERTYELGGRYSRHYGRFQPYGKALVGRGVFNYPQNSANLAYNLYAFGAGSDFRIIRLVNIRAEYEFQNWYDFKPSGLTPSMFSLGVAYHFK
jgi:hypothetical protein